MECECGKRMRSKVEDYGKAVIVGEMVWSADLYRCECGRTKLGSYADEPIRPLSEWGADWIMQPKHKHELEIEPEDVDESEKFSENYNGGYGTYTMEEDG
jgi:hypothetical protein